MKLILIELDNDNVIFKTEVEEMIYKTDINSFVENTGVTVQNVSFPIEGYYINLGEIGEEFICGNIMENFFIELKKNNVTNSLLIINFEGVDELSESFLKSYTKILLETTNKIITINMNIDLSNKFSNFVLTNIIEPEEDEDV